MIKSLFTKLLIREYDAIIIFFETLKSVKSSCIRNIYNDFFKLNLKLKLSIMLYIKYM